MITGKQRVLSLILVVVFLIGAAAIPAAASGTSDKSEAAEQALSSVSAADAEKTEEQVKAEQTETKTAKAANASVSSASVAEPEEGAKTDAENQAANTGSSAAEKTETDKGTSDSKITGSSAGNNSTAGSSTEKPDAADNTKDQPAEVSKSEAGTEPDPEKKSLDEMTDEEILIAGESLLKTAIAEADKRRGDLDIIFSGDDLALYIRYQEVKRKAQITRSGRKMLKAASAQAEIKHIYAKDYGPLIQMASAVTQEFPYMRPVGTHVHYDTKTNNAVYCANINRHFVSDTIYEVAGQWKDDEMYSALSYVFEKGVRKLNGTAKKKYSTGDSTRDWYATQMAVWGILHHFGIKDAKGWDAGFDMNQTQAIGGYENVYNMMHKLYDDALYYASKKSDGSASDPYFVMENPDYKLILQGKTDVPFYITSAEEPVYTLDIKGSSNASEASVVLHKKDYDNSQRWKLESTGETGYYFIKNEQSGKYLESDGTGNNDDIQQNTKDGSDKQKWNMIAAADGTVQFAPKAAPGKRIDVKNGVFVNGTNVRLYTANNGKSQMFRCEPADVRVKNVSSDGKYLQTDWIDVEADGDLVSRKYSLVDAPKGATIVYESETNPLSRVAVRVPIASIPAGGQCDFKIKVETTFSKPSVSYLAINDASTQELLVAGNSSQVTVSDRLAVYTIPIFGGVKINKRDADTKDTVPQGDASLKGATFEIINKSGYPVIVSGKEYADGAVTKTITTDDKGYAATGNKDLQVGTYLIRESGAPTGYLGEGVTERTFTLTALEDGILYDMTAADNSIHNKVIRGGVKIKKQDSHYQDDAAQGDAVLKDAEFTITNKSKNAIVVGGKSFASGKDVMIIRTDEKGIAQTAADALPYGSYEIRETKNSNGYLLNSVWKQSFQIRENGKIVDLTREPCDEDVIRGGVEIEKRDKELDKNEALGGASLEGIEFTITNASKLRVWIDEKSFAPGAEITKIYTDEEGHVSLPADYFPYGTYTIQETATNESYLLTDGEPRTFKIITDGEIVKANTEGDGLNFRNQVVRNEISFNKIADGTNARMDRIAFVLTMMKTGEQHVIVTDRNGMFHSGGKTNPHSKNTNANDALLKKYQDEDAVIPSDETDPKAGIWFSKGQKGSEAVVRDDLGALPYGEYRMEELRCENNIGYTLLDVKFYVDDDKTVLPVIDLGTMTDDEEEKPEIGTQASAQDTGTGETQASKKTKIIDTVKYENLKADGKTEYTMYGKLMIVPDGAGEAKELLVNGKPVTAEKTFKPEKKNGTVEMKFTFDSSALAGMKTVVFEEVRNGKLVVAAHADPKDEGQQVSIVDFGTTATDQKTGTHESEASKDAVFIDVVKYQGLTPGKQYVLKGTLMDVDTEKQLLVNGKAVTAEKEFTPDKKDGSVKMEFKLDASALAGKETVVFEDLYRDGKKIAAHADIKDEGQKIRIIKIKTKAIDKETETQNAVPGKKTVIVDTVSYEGLTQGKEYTLKGTLMDAKTGKPLKVNGKEITVEKTFKPGKAKGMVEMEFKLDSSALADKKTVVFEDLFHEKVKVASHSDLKDKNQTVTFKNPTPTPAPSFTPVPGVPNVSTPSTPVTPSKSTSIKAKPVKTGDSSKTAVWVVLMALAGAAGTGLALYQKRKK